MSSAIPAGDAVPVSVTTQWPDGTAKKTTYAYSHTFHASDFHGPNSSFPNGADFPYADPEIVTEYDYGSSGDTGAVLRTTSTTYLAFQTGNASALSQNLLDRPAQITVTDGKTGEIDTLTYGYDEIGTVSGNASAGWNSSLPLGVARANQTSIRETLNSTGAPLTTWKTYTDTGLLEKIERPTDPSVSPIDTTTYEYGSQYDGAYVTKITNALGQFSTYQYDSSSGSLLSSQDPNETTNTYSYQDPLLRLTSLNTSGGSHNGASSTTFTYGTNSKTTQTLLNSTAGYDTSTITYDGFGREIRSRHTDPAGDVFIDSVFDAAGHKTSVSTPYRNKTDPTYEEIHYTYDGLGRVVHTQHTSDNSATDTAYQGARTLSTDASNGSVRVQKIIQTDALDRLLSVCEVSATAPLVPGESLTSCGDSFASQSYQGFLTTYDQSLHGVVGIHQGAQLRTFTYDSLGRLTDTHNPETGWIHYDYDVAGNVTGETLPTPNSSAGSRDRITRNYSYDSLNRLLRKWFTAAGSTGIVSTESDFKYDETTVDGKALENTEGRLSSEWTFTNGQVQAKSVYSYDSTGKVAQHFQCVLSNCGSQYRLAEYRYDPSGAVKQLSTPQNTFSLSYNQTGQISQVSPQWTPDANHPSTLLASAQYTPSGALSNASMGNGANESYFYSPRWLDGMNLSSSSGVPGSPSQGSIQISTPEQVSSGALQAASATITFSGSDGRTCVRNGSFRPLCGDDTGSVTVSVGGFSVEVDYDDTSTNESLAQSLANGFNVDGSGVTAAIVGTVVTLTSQTPGAQGNSILLSVVLNEQGSDFQATPSGATLAGGSDATGGSLYDTGTITASLGGVSCSSGYSHVTVSYQGTDTQASIASALSQAMQGAFGCFVNASVNGNTISLNSTNAGANTNWILTTSTTFDQAHFVNGSFLPVTTGMYGGSDASQGQPSSIYAYSISQHAPNGQITSIADSINGSWTYTFDESNRLKTANGTPASFNWVYDRYGNRWQQNLTAGSGYSNTTGFNAPTNQDGNSLSYDAAGNVRTDTQHTYVYDNDNRIVQVDGGLQYVYDAEGRRVGKSDGTAYVVAAGGAVLEEYDSGVWKRSEVNVGGKHLATVTPSGVYFTHADWLGTERARTNISGQLCQVQANLPFGESVAAPALGGGITACNPSPIFFTGKERDTESGLDDFGARYLSSHWGHWMSPDWSSSPAGVPYAHMENPQSLNLYAYVGNDPINGEDADGHAQYTYGSNQPGGDPSNPYDAQIGDGLFTHNMGAHDPVRDHQHSNVLIDEDSSIGLVNFPVSDSKTPASDPEGGQQNGGTVAVTVGQRPIQNKWAQFFSELFTFHKAYHSYYRLTGDDGVTHQFEVLGNPGSSKNQQVRDTYGTGRASAGTEHTVYATGAQASALINRSEYFENHPCPVCTGGQEGYNLVFHNSNSFVYNMLSGAPGGGIPPPSAPTITPGYAKRPDDWY